MKKHFLGIDVGSGSCKVSLMDDTGRVLASAAREYSPLCVRPGWFEQDPLEWFDAFVACLKKAASDSGIDVSAIDAVATTGQMKGATFIGGSGQVVRRSILWNDLRNRAEVEELKERYGGLLERMSLNPFSHGQHGILRCEASPGLHGAFPPVP